MGLFGTTWIDGEGLADYRTFGDDPIRLADTIPKMGGVVPPVGVARPAARCSKCLWYKELEQPTKKPAFAG